MTLRLTNIICPFCVIVCRINTQSNDLDAASVELGLDFGHVAELGGANRSEVLRMREQDAPRVANPFMKPDLALGGFSLEVWGCLADLKRHGDLPLPAVCRGGLA